MTEDAVKTDPILEKVNRCVRCKKEIEPDANVCHHCGKHQNDIIYYINQFATFTALVMVIIAGAQVYVNILQMRETRGKRVEAQHVLEEARGVLTHSLEETEKIRTHAKNVLNDAKSETENAIKEAQQALKDSKAQTSETRRVAKKAEKEISDTINYVNREIEKLNDGIQKTEHEFKAKFGDITNNIEIVKNELSKEVDILKKRNELILLADKAIGDGCRESYEKLEAMIVNGKGEAKEINVAALSELLRVKTFYIGVTRIKTIELQYKEKDGNLQKDNDISTEVLARTLINSKDWRYRTKAAQLLRQRKEEIVISALIKAMISDKRLDVIKECINSFSAITGYKKADVLKHKPLLIWWAQNKGNVLKDLQQNK